MNVPRFRTVWRRGAWVVATSIVAGCTVGPDFEPSKTEMPSGFAVPKIDPAAVSTTLTSQAADVATWWQVFGDAQLDDLVTRAVESNLDVQAAVARIRQARAARGVVAGGFWPQVGVTAGAQRGKVGPAPAGSLYQAGLDASWELDVFGGLRRGVEAADADLQAAVEDRRDVLVSLTSEVALNFIELRGLQERIQVANRNLETQTRTADITRRKFEGGFTSRLDVVNADAQVASTKAVIPSLQAAAQQAIFNLGVLLGSDPTILQNELETPAPIPGVPERVPTGLPSDLLRRRPDIRRSEASLHAATARVGVATADLFPRFSLNGMLTFQNGAIPGLFDAIQRSWSVGADLLWPLFAGGSIRAKIALNEAVVDEALFAVPARRCSPRCATSTRRCTSSGASRSGSSHCGSR